MIITLNRIKMQTDGTLSEVSVNANGPEEATIFYGIEKPWRNNEPFNSCIPAGCYTLQSFDSPRFGSTWAIVGGTVAKFKGQAERYACLFHAANYGKQVEGCIGLGLTSGETEDKALAVWTSKKAMAKFFALLEHEDTHTLIIRWFE